MNPLPIKSITLHPDLFYREDMGDVTGLARSMRGPNGQLQPILVDADYRLIFGKRRLEAAKSLGWKTIEARVINLNDPLSAIEDENDCRKGFSISEKVALGKLIEAREKVKATERMKAGVKPKGKDADGEAAESIPSAKFAEGSESGRATEKAAESIPSAKFAEGSESGRATEKAAEKIGMSRPTYEKAKEVVEAAEADPSLAPVVEEMDATGNVSGAHQKIKEPPAPKPGAPVKYHIKDFDTSFGGLLRQIDIVGNLYHAKESPAAKRLRESLSQFRKDFTAWHQELSK